MARDFWDRFFRTATPAATQAGLDTQRQVIAHLLAQSKENEEDRYMKLLRQDLIKAQTEELRRPGSLLTTDPSTGQIVRREEIPRKATLKELEQPKIGSEKTRDFIQEMNIVEKNLKSYYDQLQSIPTGRVAGVTAAAKNIIGKAPVNRGLQAMRNALVLPLARAVAGHKGVATDRDFNLAESMLATDFENPEEITQKINNATTLINNARSVAQREMGVTTPASRNMRSQVAPRDAVKSVLPPWDGRLSPQERGRQLSQFLDEENIYEQMVLEGSLGE